MNAQNAQKKSKPQEKPQKNIDSRIPERWEVREVVRAQNCR